LNLMKATSDPVELDEKDEDELDRKQKYLAY
jgi:hypothetical protein